MNQENDYSLMKEHNVKSFDDLWEIDNWDWLWNQQSGMMKMVVEIKVSSPITNITEN